MALRKMLIFIIIILVACLNAYQPAFCLANVLYFGPSSVFFLEHSLTANGTIISGDGVFRSVDFPNYWYNENTGQLNGNIDFLINDSLMMIYGDSLTLKGNFGAGTGNKLFGVYSLPVNTGKAKIYSIDMSGNVIMLVNKTMILLQPGKNFTFVEYETVKDNNSTISIAYEHKYLNRGFIDKNMISPAMVVNI
jgi:hypothetical protein